MLKITGSLVLVLSALLPLRAGDAADASLARAREEVIEKTEAYKVSLRAVLPVEESILRRAEENLAKLADLFADGLVSRQQLAESEDAVRDARRRLDEAQRHLLQADALISEMKAAIELASAGDALEAENVIRHVGLQDWSPNELDRVESFFSARFGRPLPVSARGQTPLHDRMGFSHGRAVDVAVHPDTHEGSALMEYLRDQDISFIAFRSAVPGSATGAHIHIGPPSLRLPS